MEIRAVVSTELERSHCAFKLRSHAYNSASGSGTQRDVFTSDSNLWDMKWYLMQKVKSVTISIYLDVIV